MNSKVICLIIPIILTACSSGEIKLNSEQMFKFNKLFARCEIETPELTSFNKEYTEIFCNCHLKSLASRKVLEDEGIDASLDYILRQYKINLDIARAINKEDKELVNRFPRDKIIDVGRKLDSCINQAKGHFYEKEIEEKVLIKLQSNIRINFTKCQKKLVVCRVS